MEEGSGFLVSDDTIVTASHVITAFSVNSEPIYVRFYDQEACSCGEDVQITVSPLNSDWESFQLVLLKLSITNSNGALHCSSHEPTEEEKLTAYGYLGTQEELLSSKFTISLIKDEVYNLQLIPTAEERITKFNGFSGAPLFNDNAVVGVLLQQTLQDGTAIRLNAIGGISLREWLDATGVDVHIREIESKERAISTQVPMCAISEIDELQKMQFKSIQKELIAGDGIDTWAKLIAFIKNLEKSNCSITLKRDYFYIAAIWAMNNDDIQTSETYLGKAVSIDSGLDIRLYNAYRNIRTGEYEKAKQLLRPVDKIDILNAYLICFLNENKLPDAADEVIAVSGITPNAETYRILSLIDLRGENYESALEQIETAIQMDSQNYQYLMAKALVLFSSAIRTICTKTKELNFSFYHNHSFYPRESELRQLKEAAAILKKLSEKSQDTEIKLKIQSAYFVVASMIPGKDLGIIINSMRQEDPLNPHAILFGITKNIGIPESILQSFLQLSIPEKQANLYARVKMEIYIQQKDYLSAKEIFEKYTDDILVQIGMDADVFPIILALECDKVKEAELLLKKTKLNSIDRERMRLNILDRSDPRGIKEFIRDITSLARKSGETIDYANANRMCKNYKKWLEMQQNAKAWFDTTKEITALFCVVEALFEQGKYQKALKVIEKIETEAPLPTALKTYRLNSLLGLSRFEDAIEYAKSYDAAYENPQLVLIMAKSYLSMGQKSNAVTLLRTFAETNVDTNVYQLLIEQIKGEFPDEAYCYVSRLRETYPEDKQIRRYCGYTGISTGHFDDPTFYQLLQKDATEGDTSIQMLGIEEVKLFLEDSRKRMDTINREYNDGNIPIHLVAAEIHSGMGGLIYQQWQESLPILAYNIRKRKIEKEIMPSSILLDYTMCVSILELDLFDKIQMLFPKIYILNTTLPIIINDIEKMRPTQQHIADKNILLLKTLKSLEYQCVQYPTTIKIPENTCPTDWVDLYFAKTYFAKIVSEQPHGKFTKEAVPEEWYQHQLYPNELYKKLEDLEFALSTFDNKGIREDVVSKLEIGDTLLLGRIELDTLLGMKQLKNVFNTFHVIIEENTITTLERDVNSYSRSDQTISWLDNIRKSLSDLVAEKKILLAPDVKHAEEDAGPYISMLFSELQTAQEQMLNLGIDDRMGNRFSYIGKKGERLCHVLNTLDVIYLLYNKKLINQNELFSYLDSLIANRYCYFIPDKAYIMSRLNQSNLDENGILQENSYLENLRILVACALNDFAGVSGIVRDKTVISEAAAYLTTLIHTCSDTLISIWSKSDWDTAKKEGTTHWVLMTLGDGLCDTSKIQINPLQHRALKFTSWINPCFSMLKTQEDCKTFIAQIFKYFNIAFFFHPEFQQEAVQSFASFATQFLEDRKSNEEVDISGDYMISNQEALRLALAKIFTYFPLYFCYLLLKEPNMDQFQEYINFNGNYPDFAEESYLVTDVSVFDIDGVLSGDEDAFESTILYVCANPIENGNDVLSQLTDKKLVSVSKGLRYRMSRFLFELSWYLPSELQHVVSEKKRKLALID